MLAQYLIGKLKTLKLENTIISYRQVVLTTEARLLLYNRRRPGELEALDILTYKKRSTSVNETDLSLRQELTKLEKNLLHSQELVEMRGKSNNKIPLLLPEEVRKPLAYLVGPDVREAVGVKKDNQYVFASTGNEPVRAGTALDVMKYESNLRFPERILATNLRKHTATISQVMGLKDHELKWLLKHLGHTEKVHLAHYRATSGIIERLDIAKLMLMQEKNVVSRYAGVGLGDITFEELDDEGEGDAGGGGNTGDGGDEGDEGGGCDNVPEELNEEGMTRKQKKKKSTREKWTEEEMQEIDEHFWEYLAMRAEKRGPGQKECLKAISLSRAKGGALCRRHWETIKKKVFNMVNKKKRDI